MSNPNHRIRSEAVYVVCNALTSPIIENQLLRHFFDQKRCGLLEPLIGALDEDQAQPGVNMMILESLVVLVNLDFMNLNGNSTDLYSSVSFTLSTCDGYEKIT